MQLTFKFPRILKWLFLILSIFFFFPPISLASRTSEIRLICGPPQQLSDAAVFKSFHPSFVKVMASIQAQIADHKWGYDSAISPSSTVYGFAQCHNDLSDTDCQLCFSEGRAKLPRCLPSASARIYLEGCFLRYDNYSFYDESIDPQNDFVNCSKPSGILEDSSLHAEFERKVSKLIDNVTAVALNNGSFAAIEKRGGVVPVFGLAQCWVTLDEDGCSKCLMNAGSKLRLCAPGSEGRALFGGCFMRYSTDRFFDENNFSADQRSDTAIIIAIVLSTVAFIVLASFGACIGYIRLSQSKGGVQRSLSHLPAGSNLNFRYEILEKATDFFDDSKKLGQGGAGSVYKGTLPDGSTVAVKRLVYNTRQWVDQFFNEVNLISNIQHENLVRLLGCSIEGPESLLVYEYVPNRSLDQILFVRNTILILSWQQRFNIILGTAEGLAFLHGGSGVKIIHRDIKTSNILLDEKLTPKIADFGLARCVATDNSHISTGIAGTLGYMAPEYLIRGQLTEKADVYGFGVLVLEIATGKKNSVFAQGSSSILHSVWNHYKSHTLNHSVDPSLNGAFPQIQAANVLQIGLICTQASATLRPSMAEVVDMLINTDSEIPLPKQPPFLNASVLNADDNPESCITRFSLSKGVSFHQNSVAPLLLVDSKESSYITASAGSDHSSVVDTYRPR